MGRCRCEQFDVGCQCRQETCSCGNSRNMLYQPNQLVAEQRQGELLNVQEHTDIWNSIGKGGGGRMQPGSHGVTSVQAPLSQHNSLAQGRLRARLRTPKTIAHRINIRLGRAWCAKLQGNTCGCEGVASLVGRRRLRRWWSQSPWPWQLWTATDPHLLPQRIPHSLRMPGPRKDDKTPCGIPKNRSCRSRADRDPLPLNVLSLRFSEHARLA